MHFKSTVWADPEKRRAAGNEKSRPAGCADRLISNSGAEGDRTPDLRHAMAALFQLSYGPVVQSFGSL